MLEVKNTIIKRQELEVEVDLGVGAKKLAKQLSLAGAAVKGYSCKIEEIETAMNYLLAVRVGQINGQPGNYSLITFPEIFGDLVAKLQPVKTDDGIVLTYTGVCSKVGPEEGRKALDRVVAMCDRLRFRITSGFTQPNVETSNVIGIQWSDEFNCHLASKKVNNDDLMMKIWVDYSFYPGWGELRYQLEDPGSVDDYIRLFVAQQSPNYVK